MKGSGNTQAGHELKGFEIKSDLFIDLKTYSNCLYQVIRNMTS